MIDTKALREKVLDLAIRGKLVPQDPNDEPASVLLERIRAEKEQMIKDGKLKAKDIKNDTIIFKGDDNLHYEQFPDGTVKCIEDEIPFELPDGWAWCRLGTISFAIQYGLSNSAEQTGTHRLLRITDIQNGNVNWNEVPFTTIKNADDYLLHKGDIVFARTGATVGKSYLIKSTPFPAVYASYLIRISLLSNIIPEYIYHFFNSQCYWEQITDKSVGVGQPNCNGTSLKELFIPLPPVSEQLKIVPTANSVLNYILSIESNKEELKTAISSLKSLILDLAIRGKLVPQNPDDEPASVLLERIRAEKEELIKQGKIKRDKKESVIFKGEDNSYYETIGDNMICIDDTIPYRLPLGWTWCKLKSLAALCDNSFVDGPFGSNLKSEHYTTEKEVRIIQLNNIGEMLWRNSGVKYTTFEHAKTIRRCLSYPGDIVISKMMPAGRAIIIPSDIDKSFVISSDCVRLQLYEQIYNQYIMYMINSQTINSAVSEDVHGIGRSRTSLSKLKEIIIPLPPLAEQKRIVEAIEIAFTQLDEILNSIS